MIGAGEALQKAGMAALQAVEGLSGVYPGPALQAASPHALVESGSEMDWSHKTAKGREVRLFVTLRDEGERPERLQALAASAEAALETLPPEVEGWRLASFRFLRSRIVSERKGSGPAWASVSEYRARMLANEGYG